MNTKTTLMDFCSGIQHIGIPAVDHEGTCRFYEDLGFERAFETVIRDGQKVAFLRFGNVVMEVYDASEGCPTGAIDHIAIDCQDIDAAYAFACKKGYRIVSEGIEALPFWKNGVRFFIMEGPNNERIEIDQRL